MVFQIAKRGSKGHSVSIWNAAIIIANALQSSFFEEWIHHQDGMDGCGHHTQYVKDEVDVDFDN